MSRDELDLWPVDFPRVAERTPVVILRQQAALLGKKTRGLVRAEVRSGAAMEVITGKKAVGKAQGKPVRDSLDDLKKRIAMESRRGTWIEHRFQLVAPALDNYKYELFTVEHPIEAPYPLWLVHDESVVQVKSEDDLLRSLEKTFNSESTKRIIATLIEQSQAA
jgi:hypothetical protein